MTQCSNMQLAAALRTTPYWDHQPCRWIPRTPFDWLSRVSIIPPPNVTSILIGHNQRTYLSRDPICGKYRLVVRQSHEGKKSRSETDFVYVTVPHRPDVKLRNKTVLLSYSSGKYGDLVFERSRYASRVADRWIICVFVLLITVGGAWVTFLRLNTFDAM